MFEIFSSDQIDIVPGMVWLGGSLTSHWELDHGALTGDVSQLTDTQVPTLSGWLTFTDIHWPV